MESSANTNRRVIQYLRVASGVALVVLAVHSSKPSIWVSRDRNTLGRTWSPRNEKRDLQNVRYMPGGQPETKLQEHHAWPPPRDDRTESTEYSHGHKHGHSHHNRDHERNTDDDDSEDENDDDDSEDDDDSKHKNDDDDKDEDNSDSSESQSGSGSSSGGNETESAAIQSSVVTNLDGVNIGNTITIINIGTGGGGQQSSSTSADNDLNGSSPFAVNAAGRSTVTSAAIRAFCDSIGCSFAQDPKVSTSVPGSGSGSFSVGGGNGSRGKEATYEMPVVTSGGSVASLELFTWLVLVSILIQVL